MKLQQDILLDFRKLIDDNVYYLYLSKKANEKEKKKILSVIKVAKMYNCDNLIIETYFGTDKDYKSLEFMINEIDETEKVLISTAIDIEKKK